ncbi:MAG TPA: DUF1465 family protein [Hyphomicrobiaceae bacterium]|nr:DUF1465 family protein [Hyphomicrobiaceae bacterium]
MNSGYRSSGVVGEAPVAISFGERFTKSEQFNQVFNEGMALVERTAAYLEGEGRREARRLKPPFNIAYANESMRLTTRLLELASWLLIRRALRNGEITADEAARKRTRLRLDFGAQTESVHAAGLPAGLRVLIQESRQLWERIVQLDRAMLIVADGARAGENPVAKQLERLELAFAHGDGGSARS